MASRNANLPSWESDLLEILDNYFEDLQEIGNSNLLTPNCEQYDIIEDIINHVNDHDSKYTALHLNIQSLTAKHDQLKTMLTRLEAVSINIDFILLCETYLTDAIAGMYSIPGYKLVYRNRRLTQPNDQLNRRRVSRRGGVAIYIRQDIEFLLRPDIDFNVDGEFESIFIEATVGPSKVIVGEIYRIPNTCEATSLERYDTIVSKLLNTTNDVIVGSDLNFDLLKANVHKNTGDLIDNFFSCGLYPLITKPTHVMPTCATLIDNIFVNFKNDLNTLSSGVLVSSISDHYPVFMVYGKKNY